MRKRDKPGYQKGYDDFHLGNTTLDPDCYLSYRQNWQQGFEDAKAEYDARLEQEARDRLDPERLADCIEDMEKRLSDLEQRLSNG